MQKESAQSPFQEKMPKMVWFCWFVPTYNYPNISAPFGPFLRTLWSDWADSFCIESGISTLYYTYYSQNFGFPPPLVLSSTRIHFFQEVNSAGADGLHSARTKYFWSEQNVCTNMHQAQSNKMKTAPVDWSFHIHCTWLIIFTLTFHELVQACHWHWILISLTI